MKARIFLASSLAASLALALVASTAFAATLTRQLEFGDTGSDVSDLQTFLALDSTIYPQGLVTGYFGPLTQAAVSNFQARNGIDTVGRVGPITMAAINAQMGGATTVSSTVEGAGKPTNTGTVQPTLSAVNITAATSTATLSWTSSVPARARVMYSTVWPFAYAPAASVSNANYSTSQVVTLTNLQSNTNYYYVVESLDLQGNFTWSMSGPWFKTQ